MVHKRFRNPRYGYARPRAKAETSQLVDDATRVADRAAHDADGMAALMGTPPPSAPVPDLESITPQSAVPPPEPERMAVTRVVRGAAADAQPRQPTAAQRRIDRLLEMLRRSR